MYFMIDRYISLGTSGDDFLMMTPDKKTGMAITVRSSDILITYVPLSGSEEDTVKKKIIKTKNMLEVTCRLIQ